MNLHRIIGFSISILIATAVQGQVFNAYLCPDAYCDLRINGESNATDYCCSLGHWEGTQSGKKYPYYYSDGIIYMNNFTVGIPVAHFECDNRIMTRDFRNALGVNEFPNMYLRFEQLQLHAGMEGTQIQKNVKARVTVEIKGVKKQYLINVKEAVFSDYELTISGKLNVKMSAFGIDPPTAMMGMIRVYDDIEIDFNLKFCRDE